MIRKTERTFFISECASPLVARKEQMRVDAEKSAGAHLDDLNCHSDALRFCPGIEEKTRHVSQSLMKRCDSMPTKAGLIGQWPDSYRSSDSRQTCLCPNFGQTIWPDQICPPVQTSAEPHPRTFSVSLI